MCMCSWKQEHAELYFQCRSSITHAVFPFDFLCCKQGPHSRFSQNWFYRAHVHSFFSRKKTHRVSQTEHWVSHAGPVLCFSSLFLIFSLSFFFPSTCLSHTVFFVNYAFLLTTHLFFLTLLFCSAKRRGQAALHFSSILTSILDYTTLKTEER